MTRGGAGGSQGAGRHIPVDTTPAPRPTPHGRAGFRGGRDLRPALGNAVAPRGLGRPGLCTRHPKLWRFQWGTITSFHSCLRTKRKKAEPSCPPVRTQGIPAATPPPACQAEHLTQDPPLGKSPAHFSPLAYPTPRRAWAPPPPLPLAYPTARAHNTALPLPPPGVHTQTRAFPAPPTPAPYFSPGLSQAAPRTSPAPVLVPALSCAAPHTSPAPVLRVGWRAAVTSRARRGAEGELSRAAAMPKRGCPLGDAAPLQLKVRVGWRELGRGVCSERYSREIFGECGRGHPRCDARPGQAVSTGRAREPGGWEPARRSGFGSSEWGVNAPTSTCDGHSLQEVSLPPQAGGLCVLLPPGSVVRGCRPFSVASPGLTSTEAPRAQRDVGEWDVLSGVSRLDYLC